MNAWVRWVPAAMAMAACGGADEQPDTGAVDDRPAICVDAPGVGWDNFGSGFVTQYCDACHAAGVADRHGAPAEVTFDDEDQVWAWADRIVVRSVGVEATMPPQGGVDEDERYLLEVWLTCDPRAAD
ncbi:MAG: hypothetical protein ABMA64_30260 [Myxococcota bacterium]